MTLTPDTDRLISAWLDAAAETGAPPGLLGDTLARTAHLDRRPAWRISERWIPMRVSTAFTLMPRTVLVVTVLLMLTFVATIGALAVAAQPSGPPIPPPFGPARNGLIAFDSNGDIWVANVDGSGRRQITTGDGFDFSPQWSPDGRSITYWSFPNDIPVAADGSSISRIAAAANDEPGSLMLVHPGADETPTTLATGVVLTRQAAIPHWSPDSRLVAFATKEIEGMASHDRIMVVGLDGGSPTELIADGEDPVWSPDGDRIAYKGGSSTRDLGLYVADGDGTDQTPLVVDGSVYAYWEPRWAPETGSTQIAYYGSNFDIYEIDTLGGDPIRTTTDPANEYFPIWSPDGSEMAFIRVVDGTDNLGRAVVMPTGGGTERTLDHTPVYGVGFLWSPDGTMLLGYPPSGDGTSSARLLIVDAVGSTAPMEISAVGEFGMASWQRLAP